MATPQKPKRKLAGSSPPKRKSKNVKNSEADCIVCEEAILEPGENSDGDEAVFCEGDCQGWIHRKCAGLTRPAFLKLGESDSQYLCSHCMLVNQNSEINKLMNTIKDLNASIVSLTETITLLQSSVNNTNQSDQTAGNTSTSPNIPSEASVNTSANITNTKARNTDRNHNIVIYGIQECPPNMPRVARSKLDLEKVLPILNTIDTSIGDTSINDIHRLGKFSADNNRPRPILVKFLRTLDASTVLFNRSKTKKPILIKPDMTPEERKIESILLHERWNLIQQGIDRKAIKLRNGQILINNRLHGIVTDFKFVNSSSGSSTTSSTSASIAPDSVPNQQPSVPNQNQ